jgi:hypothetical protein
VVEISRGKIDVRRGLLISLGAESALAVEGSCNSCIGALGLAMTLLAAVEASAAPILSRLRAIASEMPVCGVIIRCL